MVSFASSRGRTLCAAVAAVSIAGHAPAAGSHAAEPQRAAPRAAQAVETTGLPLSAARGFDLRTSEGSWISLDVSPDGRTIVFDLLGDLYTLPIEGGRARALTQGMSYDAQPRFSPDGRRVLFISDRSGGDNVWIIDSGGGDPRQLTSGDDDRYISPEWTPDGGHVVVSKADDLWQAAPKPWLYDLQGGAAVQLVAEPRDLKLVGAAFGADAREIWFARREADWQYNSTLPQYSLAVYDRESGRLRTMSSRYGGGFRPALSPDGKWLTYGTRHEANTALVLRDLRSGEERWLAHPIQRDEQESRAPLDVLPGYAFTPDSRAVILSHGGAIWRVPVDGGAPAKIPFLVDTHIDLGPELDFEYRVEDARELTLKQIRDAVPSPDGRRLAFTALNELYVMEWPSGTPRRVAADVADGVFQPTWSPDGRSLAFVTWDDRRGGQVWRAPSRGPGKALRLTDISGFYRQPAWSPDGERIVVMRTAARILQEGSSAGNMGFDDSEGVEFVWVPAAGGRVTTIMPAQELGYPHFAGDAQRIYASAPGRGLVSFRWDGTDVREHLKFSVEGGAMAEWLGKRVKLALISPDRSRALVQARNDVYVLPVPFVGHETPVVAAAAREKTMLPDSVAAPVRRLTDVGGEFPAWSADGRRVHWSVGNAHFVHELDRKDPGYQPLEQRIAIRARRDIPGGTAVLRGARVVTMRGDEIISAADIIVRDNRIAAVAQRGTVPLPAGAKIIDLSGKTVIPGFVDTHYHAMWLNPDIHTSEVWQYAAMLAYGVTTARDPQSGTTDILTYQDRVETGRLIGPRNYSTGPGIFLSDVINSPQRAQAVVRRYADYYDTKTLKVHMAGNRRQRQWILMAARDLRLTPTGEGGRDYKINLTYAIDGFAGLEHSLPVVPLYRDVIELFRTTAITYSPTLLLSFGGLFAENYFFATENVHDDPKLRHFTPHADVDRRTRRLGGPASSHMGSTGWALPDEYVFGRQARFAKEIVEAGGNVAVGSHGQLQGLSYHWELWAIQSGGMSTHDALRAATMGGAEGIGMGRDLGSIEPGKIADLVVLDRDPLADIRNTNTIRYVMKNGRLYAGDTLDEIHPRVRKFERRYYWPPEP